MRRKIEIKMKLKLELLGQQMTLGAEACDSDDVLLVFEMFKYIAEKVQYLKDDIADSQYTCLFSLTDTKRDYWIQVMNGQIEFGKHTRENPTFTMSCTKNV